MLKDKHEKIAQLIASNPDISPEEILAQVDIQHIAYLKKLIKRADIVGRVIEIQRAATKLDIITLEQRLVLLSDMANDTNETTANRIKAIESLTKLTTKNAQVDDEGIPKDIIQPVIVQIPDNNR